MDLQGKKALVVGLGSSGVEAARLLADRGAVVSVTDMKDADELGGAISRLASLDDLSGLPVERFQLGGFDGQMFKDSDLVVLSPGVPGNHECIMQARDAGVEVIGEAGLACRYLDIPMIGITGTNGKSTTTALLGHILESCGRSVFVGGNIGTPLSACLNEHLSCEHIVAELSSFQLEEMGGYSPNLAVMLNLTPDHLNRYDCFESYIDTKMNIFRNQKPGDCVVLNMSDQHITRYADRLVTGSDRLCFNSGVNTGGNADLITFESGKIVYGGGFAICDARELKIVGRHNIDNIMAALLAADRVGIRKEEMRAPLLSFGGLPHRIEFVGNRSGVAIYNDSKATNVDSVLVAVTSFSTPLILLMGGRSKGGEYRLVEAAAGGRLKKVILFGESAEMIGKQFSKSVDAVIVDSLDDAVEKGLEAAEKGDSVLLSPGCTSFDAFDNYIKRGNYFKAMVRA